MIKVNETCYRLKGRDLFVLKNHSHNEIEFIFVINGSGMVLKNDKTFPLLSQHIYIIDARNAHIVYPQDCETYVRSKLVIDADSFEIYCKKLYIYDIVKTLFDGAPIYVSDITLLDNLYKTICNLKESNTPEAIGFINGYLIELIHWLFLHREETQNHTQNKTIQKILNFIAEKDGITSLNEISKALYMSKYYICHLFKDKTGHNISDYLSDKVYEFATRQLKNTNLSIDEIATKCGYNSASSFIRFFKNKSGKTPSELRKKKINIEVSKTQ